jgi:hypothetical protein
MLRECDGLLQFRRYWIRAAKIQRHADHGLVRPSSAAIGSHSLSRQPVTGAGVVHGWRGGASPRGRTGRPSGPSSLAYASTARLPCLWSFAPRGCLTRSLGSAFGGRRGSLSVSTTAWARSRPSNAFCMNGRTRWLGTTPSTGWLGFPGSTLRSSSGRAMTRLGAAPTRGFGERIWRLARWASDSDSALPSHC